MQGYEKQKFEADTQSGYQISHDVYMKGTGPLVVIIQELPGIGLTTLSLAERFISGDYTVILPHLFGPLGKSSTIGNTVRVFCLRREFSLFAKHKTSPIVDWLRALCRHLKDTHNVEGVAVIGMCLTGNFAISLMADDAVLAGIAAQPSLPFGGQNSLHMSEQDIGVVKEKLNEKGPMLGYRFEKDKICKAAKFDCIENEFNTDRQQIRLRTLPGKGHSVFTEHFVDTNGHPTHDALNEVLTYFRSALRG